MSLNDSQLCAGSGFRSLRSDKISPGSDLSISSIVPFVPNSNKVPLGMRCAVARSVFRVQLEAAVVVLKLESRVSRTSARRSHYVRKKWVRSVDVAEYSYPDSRRHSTMVGQVL